MCWKASNTEVWMYVTTSFITNTSEDKPLKCTEHTDHLHRNNQDKNEQRQWQYTGHKFQAMCREIFPVDSILAMCSLPISDYHWVWHVTTEMKQTGEKKNPQNKWKHNMTHKTNSDSSAVCCVFAWMPTAPWQTEWLHSGEWCTGLPYNQRTPLFFFFKSQHLTVSLTDQL